MAKERAKFRIPHDKEGNQLSWWWSGNQYDTDPYEFEGTLEYNGFSRGRSALNIEWRDVKTGKTYQSGMALLDEHLKFDGTNRISGTFGFKKQGTAVLLTLVKE